jgi:hypothetical protein
MSMPFSPPNTLVPPNVITSTSNVQLASWLKPIGVHPPPPTPWNLSIHLRKWCSKLIILSLADVCHVITTSLLFIGVVHSPYCLTLLFSYSFCSAIGCTWLYCCQTRYSISGGNDGIQWCLYSSLPTIYTWTKCKILSLGLWGSIQAPLVFKIDIFSVATLMPFISSFKLCRRMLFSVLAKKRGLHKPSLTFRKVLWPLNRKLLYKL